MAGRRSSIYNKVNNQARRSDCSFGASGGFSQDIRVGWGSDDSHTLANIEVTEAYSKRFDAKVFRLYVNDELIREAVHTKDGCEVDWVL